MKEFKVLTVRDVSFTDDSGKQVQGLQLWCSSPSDAPGWRGVEVLKIWIPSDSIHVSTVDALRPDDLLHIIFNRYGKPDSIEVVQ